MALGTQRDPKNRFWSLKIALGGFKVALGGEQITFGVNFLVYVCPSCVFCHLVIDGWACTRMTESALSARLKLQTRPLGPWKGGLGGNHWRAAGRARFGFNGDVGQYGHSDDGKRAIGAIGVAGKAARPLERGSGGKPLAWGWAGTRI